MDAPTTRTQTKLFPEYGIDSPLDELLGGNVPSNRDIVCHYYHHHRILKLSGWQSLDNTAQNVLARWAGSNVPLLSPRAISEQIKALIDEIR